MAAPFLNGWSNRKTKTIQGSTSGEQTNYQKKVVVYKGTQNTHPLPNWSYIDTITINSINYLTDYQVLITLDTLSLINAGKMQPNGNDIRFTDVDNITILSYWIESGINTTNTRIWIKVPILTDTNKIYIHYGNPTAPSASNGKTTFEFFDDFDSIDTNVWGGTATATASNSIATISGGVNAFLSIQLFPLDRKTVWRVSMSSSLFAIVGVGTLSPNEFAAFYANYQSSNSHNAYNRSTSSDSSVGLGAFSGFRSLEITRHITGNSYSIDHGTITTISSINTIMTKDAPLYILPQSQNVLADWVFVCKSSETEPTFSITNGFSINNDVINPVKDDFSDIRFTKSDGITLLPYWIESYTNGVKAIIWIKIDTIPLSPNTINIYLYYNNPSALSLSNGSNTFVYFNDFSTQLDFDQYYFGILTYSGNDATPWSLSNNKLKHTEVHNENHEVAIKNITVTNTSIKMLWNLDVLEAIEEMAIVLRWSSQGIGNPLNYYKLRAIYSPVNNRVGYELMRLLNGVEVTITTFYFTIINSTWYTAEMKVVGSSIKCYHNNILIISVTDTNLTSGFFGIGGAFNTGVTSFADDYVVKKFTTPEPTWIKTENEEIFIPKVLGNLYSSIGRGITLSAGSALGNKRLRNK